MVICLDAQILIEAEQTTVLRPIGYGIIQNGRVIAVLTPQAVEAARQKFQQMTEAHTAYRNCGAAVQDALEQINAGYGEQAHG